jgi:hypothetical protein
LVRQSPKDRRHRQLRVLGQPEKTGDGRGEDHEGKQRQKSQIGEVAGVDEAVVVEADPDPLGDDQRLDLALGTLDRRLAEARPQPGQPLAPFLGRIRMKFLHSGGLNPKCRSGVAATVPTFDEFLKRFIVRWNVDGELDQLVAPAAVLGGEAPALDPKDLARA